MNMLRHIHVSDGLISLDYSDDRLSISLVQIKRLLMPADYTARAIACILFDLCRSYRYRIFSLVFIDQGTKGNQKMYSDKMDCYVGYVNHSVETI